MTAMPDEQPGPGPDLHADLARVRHAIDDATAHIEQASHGTAQLLTELETALGALYDRISGTGDDLATFTAAGRLLDMLHDAGERAGALRAATVARMREARGLSMARVAADLGLSKPRVQDMLRDHQRRQAGLYQHAPRAGGRAETGTGSPGPAGS